jgi:hypothetical protein
LEFELEVRDGSQPANDGRGFPLNRKIDQQALQRRDLHFFDVPDGGLEQVEPLPEGEKRMFLVVVRDSDDYFVEQFAGAIDDVQVPVRHRVEAAGVNRASDH